MKILVLGAAGMAGYTISHYLNEKGHDVTGFSRRKIRHCKSIEGDATDTELVANLIKKGQFDSVINCIGILNQFAENSKDMAVYLNSYFPHCLADITKDMKTQIIHMSTDCVFSGKNGNYTEKSFRDGDTFYDRSKALGEIEDEKNITFRNSIVGPDINKNGIGLLNWFMRQDGLIEGYSEVYWTGITTLHLAQAMEKAAEVKGSGLHNMVNNSIISKYELLKLFNKYFKNNKLDIIKNEEIVLNKSLKRENFDLDFEVPDYEKMVCEMAQWVKRNIEFFPHYRMY
ncbi:sugar nucleotide-binding protein [Luminiphilus sp.]|nr:sugar nucleotide-binding protein [Luminiphilus sp.]MDB2313490.1 sugar nucleotide-binding protein [Luminiphilus sp.]